MPRSSESPPPEQSVSAYGAALRLIAARELSEAQIRERLRRKEYDAAAIEDAIGRLRRTGAVDDRRTALARARTESRLKHHGPARVLRQLAAIGIDRETAASAVREVFAAEDEPALLDVALAKRLRRARRPLTDPAERRRVVAHLMRLGFAPDAISTALRRARSSASAPDHSEDV